MAYNALETGREAIESCLWIPNDLLPPRYHDKREGGRTISRIKRIYDRQVAKRVTKAEEKAEKARRAEMYRQQLESGQPINYDECDARLYSKQLAFCETALRAGFLTPDDFEE